MSLHFTQYFGKGGVAASVHVHNLTSVRAGQGSRGSAWVTFKDDAESEVTMHVDDRLAEMLAEAFAEYHDWLSGQEGPTFDDALAAKCSAKAHEDAARALK